MALSAIVSDVAAVLWLCSPDASSVVGHALVVDGLFHDLVVDPAHRGNGIGRMLLDATLAALKARGAPRVVLSTAERNASAQRLFARAGFRRTMIEMTHELDDVAS